MNEKVVVDLIVRLAKVDPGNLTKSISDIKSQLDQLITFNTGQVRQSLVDLRQELERISQVQFNNQQFNAIRLGVQGYEKAVNQAVTATNRLAAAQKALTPLTQNSAAMTNALRIQQMYGESLERQADTLRQLSSAQQMYGAGTKNVQAIQSATITNVQRGTQALSAYGAAFNNNAQATTNAARAQEAFISPLGKQASLMKSVTLSQQIFGDAVVKSAIQTEQSAGRTVQASKRVQSAFEGVSQSGRKTASFLQIVFKAFEVAPAFTLAYDAIRLVQSAISFLFKEITSGIEKLSTFKLQVAEIAGILAVAANSTDPKAFSTFIDFAETARVKLEVLGATALATGAEIFRGFQEITERGVILDTTEQFKDLINVVNAISLIAQGTGKPIQQISQEVRLFLEGNLRPGAELLQVLKGINPQIIEQVRALDTMQERWALLTNTLEPFKQVQAEISNTLQGQIKLTRTIFDVIERGGATQTYERLVALAKKFNDYLFDGVGFTENANSIATLFAQTLEVIVNLGKALWDILSIIGEWLGGVWATGWDETTNSIQDSVNGATLLFDVLNRILLITSATAKAAQAIFVAFRQVGQGTMAIWSDEAAKNADALHAEFNQLLVDIGNLTEKALNFSQISLDTKPVKIKVDVEDEELSRIKDRVEKLLQSKKSDIDLTLAPKFSVDNKSLNKFFNDVKDELVSSKLHTIPVDIQLKRSSATTFRRELEELTTLNGQDFKTEIQPVLKPGSATLFTNEMRGIFKNIDDLEPPSIDINVSKDAVNVLGKVITDTESAALEQNNLLDKLSALGPAFLQLDESVDITKLGFTNLSKEALNFEDDSVRALGNVQVAVEDLYEAMQALQFFKISDTIEIKNERLKAQLDAIKGIGSPEQRRKVSELTGEIFDNRKALDEEVLAVLDSSQAMDTKLVVINKLYDKYGDNVDLLKENSDMEDALRQALDKGTSSANKQKTAAESLIQTWQKLREASASEFESPFLKILDDLRDVNKKIADAGPAAIGVEALMKAFESNSIREAIKPLYDFNKGLEDSNRIDQVKIQLLQTKASLSDDEITALVNEQEQLYIANQLRMAANEILAKQPELLKKILGAIDEWTEKIHNNTQEQLNNTAAMEEAEKWHGRIHGAINETKDALEESENALKALEIAQKNNLPITDEILTQLAKWVELLDNLKHAQSPEDILAAQEALERYRETLSNTFKLEEAKKNFVDFTKILEDFAEEAAKNIQDAFADFFFAAFSGKLDSFEDVWKSFLDALLKMLANFIALAIVQLLGLEKVFKSIFNVQGFDLGNVVGGLDTSTSSSVNVNDAIKFVDQNFGWGTSAAETGTRSGVTVVENGQSTFHEGATIGPDGELQEPGAGGGAMAGVSAGLLGIGIGSAVGSMINADMTGFQKGISMGLGAAGAVGGFFIGGPIGAAIGGFIGSLIVPIITAIFKKPPRLDIDFDSVKTEMGRRAALVSEILDPDFFKDSIAQISVKRGGVGLGRGGDEGIKDAIQKVLAETVKKVRDIINKLPSDMAAQLNAALLQTPVDTETVVGGERLLEFDAKGKKIAEKFEAFINGELQAKFLFAIRDFFKDAFVDLGVLPEKAQEVIDKELEKFKNAGSREARAKVGEELLELFNAYVDVFNIAVGNVNDPISQSINKIKSLQQDLMGSAEGTSTALQKLQDSIVGTGKSGIITLPELQEYAKSILETGEVSPETAEKLMELRQAIIDVQLAVAQSISSLVAMIDDLNSKIVGLGGTAIDVSGALQMSIDELIAFYEQGGLSPAEMEQILSQIGSSVDQWVNGQLQEQQAAAQAAAEAQKRRIQGQIDSLNKEKSKIEEVYQARIDALEKELDLAKSINEFLKGIDQNILELLTGNQSIEGVQQRLARINEAVESMFARVAGASGEEKLTLAKELQDLINQSLDIAGEAFQNPSLEFRDQFRNTIQQLEELKALIGPTRSIEEISASIEAIQKEMDLKLGQIDKRIDSLQNTLSSIGNQQIKLTGEAAAQARAYYEWIRQEAIKLLDLRLKELQEIGVNTDSTLSAQEQLSKAGNDLLTQIRDILAGLAGFSTGGYIEPGRVQLGVLHGGKSGEIVAPVEKLSNYINGQIQHTTGQMGGSGEGTVIGGIEIHVHGNVDSPERVKELGSEFSEQFIRAMNYLSRNKKHRREWRLGQDDR